MSEAVVSSPRVFDFQDHAVRILGTPEAPLFVAVDVCRILEIANPSDALRRLDADEITLVPIEGASNGLPVNAVNEPGLYTLVLGSRKPQAKAFKRWVTHEVLPAIRKTGKYEMGAGESEALAGPERQTEPRMFSVPGFLSAAGAAEWPEQRLIRFGGCCRLIAKNFGLAYKVEADPVWGEIRVYPEAVLRLAWRRMAPVAALGRSYQVQGEDEVLKVLASAVAKLEKNGTVGLSELVSAAREAGICGDLIPATGQPSLDARKALGRRLQSFRGKELRDSKGRAFAFFHDRTKAGVRYPISFLNEEGGAK